MMQTVKDRLTNNSNGKNDIMKTEQHTLKARARHHAALLGLANSISRATGAPMTNKTGLQLWRMLARIEREANRIACKVCNGEIGTDGMESHDAVIKAKVARVFGGTLPPGFFYNKDPRGYSLKLEEASVPFQLHEDWGRYQILAPEIN